jgi:hypothetical protein
MSESESESNMVDVGNDMYVVDKILKKVGSSLFRGSSSKMVEMRYCIL